MALLRVGLPTALYFAQTAPIIATAERDDSGIAPLRALPEVVRLTQQHRGLSVGMLGCNAKLQARRPETRDALVQALGALDQRLAGASEPRLDQWAEHKPRCRHWSRRSRSASSNRPKARSGTPR